MVDVIQDNAPALSATTDNVLTPPPPIPTSASANTIDIANGRAVTEVQPVVKTPVEAAEPAAEPVSTETADKAAEAAVEPAKEAVEATAEPAKEAAAEPKGVAKRLAELVAQREAATRLADLERDKAAAAQAKMADLEARLAELTKPKAPEVAAEPRPSRLNFDTPEAYDAALAQWAAKEGAREATALFDARQAAAQKAAADAEIAAANRTATEARQAQDIATAKVWQERRIDAMARLPDYETIAENPDLPINNAMAQSIVRASNGPDLAYHLGKNIELAKSIAAMPDGEAIFRLADLAAELRATTASKPVAVSKAPAPIKPVSNANTAREKAPGEMTMAEYAAARMKQVAGRPAFLPDGRGATGRA